MPSTLILAGTSLLLLVCAVLLVLDLGGNRVACYAIVSCRRAS